MGTYNTATCRWVMGVLLGAAAFGPTVVLAQAHDPGVRHAATDGGPPPPLPGLTADEQTFFQDGVNRFETVEVVSGASGTQGNGLGPTFNSNQCSSCHQQPFVGGSSPPSNPQVAVAHAAGATNQVPWFVVSNGPVREARFKTSNGAPDGGVHALFTITGRTDAGSCTIAQPSFTPAGNGVTGQGGNPNIIFRIPTPTMGAGLIESINDSTILASAQATAGARERMGIGGSANRSGNDGTITRFGWKAQNKSLLMFAGEAYNVEMGISNQLFQQERNETPSCQGGNSTPNDTVNFSSAGAAVLSDIEAFADFMRMLAPPTPASATSSTEQGSALFASIGCSLCHTPTLTTGRAIGSGSATNPSAALSNKAAHLFSDMLVHHMGTGLSDGISQGNAGPDQFRTAPLWGVGQRVYFLHDGRTNNIITAIMDHASSGSEANAVVENYEHLTTAQQQALVNFLRSL